jgi:UDP:flavonoid glycosyltransferase YjiC (YdhE family)
LERIEGRGMICRGWAPQVEVLAHKAVGGFVSHCGWNSILESLWHAVPIVTWPIYAEQQLNAFEMVRELGLAMEMRLDYRSGGDLVMAEEIERAVSRLMDGGNEVRKKVKEMGEMARKAVMDGGSSFTSIGQLIEDMIGSS